MSLLQKARKSRSRTLQTKNRWRICRFEQMEPRQIMLVMDRRLNVGAAYYQPHDGNDSVGSLLYISWNSSAQAAQLTDLYIDTHKVAAGGNPQVYR